MTTSPPDLHALRRAGAPAHPGARVERAHTPVPRPRARLLTRTALPLTILAAAVGILAYAARDLLEPAMEVRVERVIPTAGTASPPVGAGSGQSAGAPPAGAEPTSTEPGPVLAQAPGWIEPAPYAVTVPALAAGVVREVTVLEGEAISADQVVARLVDDDARLALRAASTALESRTADVDAARAAIAEAEAQTQVRRLEAEELRDEVSRKRELVDAGGIGAGEFHRMEIRLRGLQARVAAAERGVDQARAAARQAESALASARVALDEAALHLERMSVRSPVAGVVLSRLVEPGTRIGLRPDEAHRTGNAVGGSAMGGAVLRVYDPARLQVRVDVPLADSGAIGVGTPATVTTEAAPDATFRGTVTRVLHEADIQRNTVQFKVALESPSALLKPEMLTRVRFHATAEAPGGGSAGGTAPGAMRRDDGLRLLVPEIALARGPGGATSVWAVVAEEGVLRARLRDVVVAPSSSPGYATILEGLRLTDRVIVDPPPGSALRDGMRVRVLDEGAPAPAAEASP